MKLIKEPEQGTFKDYGTLFEVSMFEDDAQKLVIRIEELPHDGRRLNAEMERTLVEHFNKEYTATDASIEYQVKRQGEREFHPLTDKRQEIENQESEEPGLFDDSYYLKKEKPTYIYEEAGREEGKPEICVLSNTRDAPTNMTWKYELDVAKEIAERTERPLADVTLYVQQDEGKYLVRTFREYVLTPGEQGVEEQGRVAEVNFQDRKSGYLTRKDIDDAISRLQGQGRDNSKSQPIDLSKHSLDREPER